MKLLKGENSTKPQPVKVELPPMNLKLDGSATYLSWSRRVRGSLAGRNLEGYLTGEKEEPRQGSEGRDEWKSTNMLLYCWLLNSMVPSIAATVDGIEKVKDIWEKLRRTYAGVGNNFRVFQIIREIYATVQGNRTVQEYAIELERLWVDYDYFLPRARCKNPECNRGEALAQDRTMKFLQGLAPAFEQRTVMLLSQTRFPPLEEAISAMMQEESRIRLQAGAGRLPKVRSALVVSNSGITGTQGKTRKCYNCGEIGHLRQACPKSPKERYSGGHGQVGGHGRGRGGRRGGRGGYRANLMATEEEGQAAVVFTDEDQELLEILKRKHRAAGDGDKKSVTEDALFLPSDNTATYACLAKGDLSREGDRSETWDWHVE